MKLILTIICSLLLSNVTFGGTIIRSIGKFITSAPSRIKMDSPAAGKFGFISGGRLIGCSNSSLYFHSEIIAGNEVLGMLAPKSSMYDLRKIQLLNQEIPITACFYDDRDGEYTYVGMAQKVIRIGRSKSSPTIWESGESIIGPDGKSIRNPSRPLYPSPNINEYDRDFKSRSVAFPQKHWDGALIVQIANNTNFQIQITKDGRTIREEGVPTVLNTGDVYSFTEATEIFQQGKKYTFIEVYFYDGSRLIGKWSKQFNIPRSGIKAEAIMLLPRDIK